MSTVEIYALCCPDTGVVRYIGKANDSEKRLLSHFRDSKRRNTPVYCWIRNLKDKNKMPELRVLSIVDATNWMDEERSLISKYRAIGPLLNVADGGDEPMCSKETRASNGRMVSKLIAEDPILKAVWLLKKGMGHHIKYFTNIGKLDVVERLKEKMRKASKDFPEYFGSWAYV